MANRVAEIRESSCVDEWQHVKSELNPADVISRGTSPEQLIQNTFWWQGPEFLKLDSERWPTQNYARTDSGTDAERKKPVQTTFAVYNTDHTIFEKFSSLTKLQRVVAFMLRFIHNTKHDNTSKLKGDLSRAELNKSMTTLVRLVQQDYFSQEISLLKRGKHLPKSSKILSLDPFIDEECLLRVRGRLKNSQESYDKIHPILLPSTHNFTRAIIKYEHVRNMQPCVRDTGR